MTAQLCELKTPLCLRGREVILPAELEPGRDYYIKDQNGLQAFLDDSDKKPTFLGGFHVSLSGQILSNSLWDAKWRPSARDPRGMVLIAGKFWCDIYLMNRLGLSQAGTIIADGYNCLPDGCDNLTQKTAEKILAERGKRLLSRGEFALAADGVIQGRVAESKQSATGRIEGLTSKWGLEQATGTLWVWSREVDEDKWPYILGGSWFNAGNAGPAYVLYNHPDSSGGSIGARGRCDHLNLV